jgi:drug/metabolite transporter (DMT)-like permease
MDAFVFIAVLAAALLHASWNAWLKGGGDPFLSVSHTAMMAALVSGSLLPFVAFPIAAAWPWLIASAVLHTGYRFALIQMYRAGDLAQVYPIARGAAPLMTASVTALAIGEQLTVNGYAGIGLLTTGVFLLSLKGGRLGGLDRRAAGAALLTSLWITGYSFVDGYGARVNGSGPSFAIWMFFINAVVMIPIVLVMRGREVLSSFKTGWPMALGITVMSETAYFIAIWAMTKAPIALVAALRETSVFFAAVLAVVFLKEPLTRWRLLAALIIVFGAGMMRLG